MIDLKINSNALKFANLFRMFTVATLCVTLSTISISQALAVSESSETINSDESAEYQSAGVVPAVGSTLKWEIEQTVNTRGVDTYNKYKTMQFIDELAPCITYDHVEVVGLNNANITSLAGSVEHDETTNTVTFSFFETWLQETMPLVGETYKCTIYGVVNAIPSDNIIKNNAKVLIDELEMTSNETRTPIQAAAITVKHIAKSEMIIPNSDGKSTIAYETTIKQTNQGAAVRDLIVSEDFGQDRTLVKNSLAVSNSSNNRIDSVVTELDNGFSAYVERLDYGQDIVLTYTCNVENAAIGKNISSSVEVSGLGINTITTDPTNTFIVDTNTPRTINITQQVPTNNLLENHGSAFFVYILSGQDYTGKTRQFKQACTFDPISNSDNDGLSSSTCSFSNIPAGTYTLRQVSCLRYTLDTISRNDSNSSESNQIIELDLMRNTTESLNYENSKKYWDGQSYSTYLSQNE